LGAISRTDSLFIERYMSYVLRGQGQFAFDWGIPGFNKGELGVQRIARWIKASNCNDRSMLCVIDTLQKLGIFRLVSDTYASFPLRVTAAWKDASAAWRHIV
jgi:hypothetical protein